MSDVFEVFVSCPKGLEYILAEELVTLDAKVIKTQPAGVRAAAEPLTISRLCLWSRVANRVFLPLAEAKSADREGIYKMAAGIRWQNYLVPGEPFWISAFGQAGSIKHSRFGAQVVNDAIKDYFRQHDLPLPVIEQRLARQTLQLSISRNITLSIDLTGRSLHQRGYRQEGEVAPLKENLAAALLIRAGWPDKFFSDERKDNNSANDACHPCLIDPMCGSGTLLLEGAMMAMDIAPGLHNPKFAFLSAPWFDSSVFAEALEEAQQRAVLGKRKWQGKIIGMDISPAAISSAKRNLARSGLDRWIEFKRGDATSMDPSLVALAGQHSGENSRAGRSLANLPQEKTAPHSSSDTGIAARQPGRCNQLQGLVICNPPYGERLGDTSVLKALYRHFGVQLKTHFSNFALAMITSNKILAKEIGMRAEKEYKFFNGTIPATLYLFTVYGNRSLQQPEVRHADSVRLVESHDQLPAILSESAQMFANRLQKNYKKLKRWIREEQITAYRVYDADIPEYAVAVDRYGDAVCIQEYKPPKQIEADKAERRILEVLEVVPKVLAVSGQQVFLKQRKKQKGNQQYQRYRHQHQELIIEEYGCKFLVNLSDFLDTGLFLDHRPIRRYVQQNARDKRFLNLFCYTAAASVHAAVGGAASTTSVDLSKTYLGWAERNFSINGLLAGPGNHVARHSEKHRFERANAVEWLTRCRQKFDLIFLDPPTFSNSKSMANELDIQRDHVTLIQSAMQRLVPKGLLIFSTNNQRFQLNEQLTEEFAIDDKTAFSLPVDFNRKRAHQCWFIRH